MKIAIWLVACIFSVNAALVSAPVFAWDDPKPYPAVYLVTLGDSGSWITGTYQGVRWPSQVSGGMPTRLDAPPQLSVTQASRWRSAMPAAKPRLAVLYGVPQDTAELYGAKYITLQKGWSL